jgi:hypothetical protein
MWIDQRKNLQIHVALGIPNKGKHERVCEIQYETDSKTVCLAEIGNDPLNNALNKAVGLLMSYMVVVFFNVVESDTSSRYAAHSFLCLCQ